MRRENIAVHLLAWLPAVWLVYQAANGLLSFNPIQDAERRTGLVALILLAASLACTPLQTITGLRWIHHIRRPLGVYSFLYAAAHLAIFVGVDYAFEWRLLIADTANKRFIFAGLGAFILLAALAATSWGWWKKRLGKGWKRLHRLVYLAAPLVILHFAWIVKGDVTRLAGDIVRPVLYGSLIALLLILRLPPIRRRVAALRQRWLPGRRPRVPSQARPTSSQD